MRSPIQSKNILPPVRTVAIYKIVAILDPSDSNDGYAFENPYISVEAWMKLNTTAR